MAWSKESRQSRGYGANWDRLRKVILARDCGLCQPCLRAGITHPGDEVDHIIGKAKAKALGWSAAQIDAETNLQCINKVCHKAKTAADEGKKLRQKVTIGVDGWPVKG